MLKEKIVKKNFKTLFARGAEKFVQVSKTIKTIGVKNLIKKVFRT
jgi:hypothetical protein